MLTNQRSRILPEANRQVYSARLNVASNQIEQRGSSLDSPTNPSDALREGRIEWAVHSICVDVRAAGGAAAGISTPTILRTDGLMARDFWFKRFNHKRLRRSVSFTAVHPSPQESPPVVETCWRRL